MTDRQSQIEHGVRVRTILDLSAEGALANDDGRGEAIAYAIESLGIEPEEGWPENRPLASYVADLLRAGGPKAPEELIQESYRPSYPPYTPRESE